MDVMEEGMGFIEHGSEEEAPWLEGQKGGTEMKDGTTGIDEVLEENDGAVPDGLVEAYELVNLSRGAGTGIGGYFDEGDFSAGDSNLLDEVGGEHKGTVENGEEEGTLAGKVTVDFSGNAGDFPVDTLGGDKELKLFIVQCDSVHRVCGIRFFLLILRECTTLNLIF